MNDEFVNFVRRAPASLRSRLTIISFRFFGANIGKNCRLVRTCIPRNPWDIELADGVALDDSAVLLTTGPRTTQPRIQVGSNVYMNRHTMIDASRLITIGSNSMIGPFCYITDHDHNHVPSAGTAQYQGLVEAEVKVGSNVWIGAGAIILKGVVVGNDVVIGAGSVVTKSIPDGARVAGNPAQAIGENSSGAKPRKKQRK